MTVNLKLTRKTTLFGVGTNDQDGDGVIDPGDIVLTQLRLENIGSTGAQNITVEDDGNGLVIDPSTIRVTPIAFDDTLATITGNTPVIISKASLLGNDVDPDGLEVNITITGTSNVSGGTLIDNGNGTLTFTPTTGFNGTASFQYTITDEDGLSSVSTGVVTIPVSNYAWYVDAMYDGANGASDGSYLRPFTSFAPLNDDGTAGGPGGADSIKGDDDVDGANNIIFVYNRGGTYTGGITLESGQTLYGDGHEFTINNIAIGHAGQTAGPTINFAAYGITLASGNTVKGVNLNGTSGSAVAIQDGGGTVGNLTIEKVAVSGAGQIIDIDQGGALNVTLSSAASNGTNGANGGVIDLTGVSGTFTVAGSTTITGTHNQTGIDIAGNTSLSASFNGMTKVDTGASAAVILGTSTTSSTSFTGGLDIDTAAGGGLSVNGQTLSVTGSNNTINTGSGAILTIVNTIVGAGNIEFATLASTSTTVGTAININNLDGGSFHVGTATVAGSNTDGIYIGGGSSTQFDFDSATIGFTSGAGILLSGANGTVNFDTVSINASSSHGLWIDGATNSVTVAGGNIGATNDPAGDAVRISGGTGNVTIAASITKASAGNVVEVNDHETGTVTFSGVLKGGTAAAPASEGIIVTGVNSGTVAFTGETTLFTAGTAAVTLTNNSGGTINFSAGGNGLDITTTTGAGFTATGGGTISVTGAGNTINSTGGATALNVANTNIGAGNLNFQSISSTGGSAIGIILDTTGSSGGLKVNGVDGADADTAADAASGGTISNKTGADLSLTTGTGIYLKNTSHVSLSGMQLNDFTNSAITGNGVTNFALSHSTINGLIGDNVNGGINDNAVHFDSLFGTALITNNNISSGSHTLFVQNTSGTLNRLTVADNSFGQNLFLGANTVTIAGLNSGTVVNSTIRNNSFSGARDVAVRVSAESGANTDTVVTNNTMNLTHPNELGSGIVITGNTSASTVGYTISGNNIQGSKAGAILVNGFHSATSGSITNNTVGNAAVANSGSEGGSGISLMTTSGNFTTLVSGNQIYQANQYGVYFQAGGIVGTWTGTHNVTIVNNTVGTMGNLSGLSRNGIHLNVGTNSGQTYVTTAQISGNSLSTSGSEDASGVGQDIVIRQRQATTIKLSGYAGATSDTTAVQNFLAAQNSAGGTPTVLATTSGSGGGITGGPAPTQPLLAAAAVSYADVSLQEQLLGDSQIDNGEVSGAGATEGGDPSHNNEKYEAPVPATEGERELAPQNEAPVVVVDDGILTQAELALIVEAAIQRWIDAGATAEQVAAMRAVKVDVMDMVGVYLGTSSFGLISIDSDGAGHGWFIDTTPGDDGEFSGSGHTLTATATGGAAGKLDLLTVVMHELGHQIGLRDEYSTGEAGSLMYGYLNTGERRLPEDGEAAGVTPGTVTGTAYALAPVSVGDLPAGKIVDIYFNSEVRSVEAGFITNPTATTTVKGSNFSTVTVQEVMVLDTLTLGDRVFIDADKDGAFDSGEGVQGVALTLFVDNGTVAGELDPGDTQVGTTTTLAGGTYTFAGLAEGNYIVRVDASNFASGGALSGKVSGSGSADPDDNVDGDDNGVPAIGGSVASKAITLSYNHEGPNFSSTLAGVSGDDTNNTLDFGFIAANQAPTIGALNGDTGTFTENGAAVAIDVGRNATVSDSDSSNFAGGSLTVTLPSGTGDSLIFGAGTGYDGTNVSVGATTIGTGAITNGSLVISLNSSANAANVQTLIRAFEFSTAGDNPTAGARTITFTLVDGDGTDGGLGNDTVVATATVNVIAVNDAPSGTNRSDSVQDNATLTFEASDFSSGMTDQEGHAFAGVKVTTLPGAGTIKLAGTAITAGTTITKAQLDAGELTYEPAAGAGGTAPTFTFQVQDNGGTANSGVDLDQSPNTFTINVEVSNTAPTVDLDGSDAGTGFAAAYTEGGAAAAIGNTDAVISDPDAGDQVESATITVTNSIAGDVLNVVGPLPGLIAVDALNSTATKLILTGSGTQAEYAAAIKQVTFSSTSQDPTAGGTNSSRTITVTVSDGDLTSNTATATIAVADDNADAPSGTSSTITALEDGFRLINVADLGFSDADGTFATVTITAVSGGGIYFDADGSGGSGTPVLQTLPETYSAQDLIDGKVSFKASANANGDGRGSITFAVTDDDGNTDGSSNLLTVNVTPQNDQPTQTQAAAVNATEQTAVAIFSGVTIGDIDLDAKNGGAGDWKGGSFGVNRNPASNAEDVFTLVAGANFTIDGVQLKAGGLTFGQISANTNGLLVVTFTSSETAATTALVNEVVQAIRYTNGSDTPPTLVTLAYGPHDGSPGEGQGAGAAPAFDVKLVTVNIAATNDAPMLDLNGATTGTGTTVSYTEQAVPSTLAANLVITDVDDAHIDSATLTITGGLQAGGDFLTINGAGSGTSGNITWSYNGQTGVLALTGLATVAAYQALLRQAGFESTSDAPGTSRTITWKVNDGSADSNLPTTTLNITATPDASVAKPDDVTIAENQVLNGNLFADNGNGVDQDPDGEPLSIALVNGQAANVGATIALSSGAKLTVNADGTFSYDPDGKFNYLVSASKAAATGVGNNSQTESFTYTLTDGNQVTVTVNVTGVDGADDQLRGDANHNTITGTATGDLFILDGGGDDTVFGLGGNDFFYFGAAMTGADRVEGGAGTDTVGLIGVYDDLTFTETSLIGVERLAVYSTAVIGGSLPGSYTIHMHDANVASGEAFFVTGASLQENEKFIFNGSAETNGTFTVHGGAGADIIAGGARSDYLIGGGGNDQLFGMAGNDFLVGGAGADQLRGGFGRDTFRYLKASDSTVAAPDRIVDFEGGSDKIDLSAIDANGDLDGNGAFTFINGAAFSGTADARTPGQLRASYDFGSKLWSVEGDIDGDGNADFLIHVMKFGNEPIVASDFLL